MPAISILKKSRTVEFAEGITKEELVGIILKWAPRIAKDEDLSPYGLANPQVFSEIDEDSSVEDMFGFLDAIGTPASDQKPT